MAKCNQCEEIINNEMLAEILIANEMKVINVCESSNGCQPAQCNNG